jgi:hypothetical protein
MSPLLKAALASLLRHALTGAGSYFVAKGIWSEEAATEYMAALALFLVSVGWSLFQKYATHLLILDALDAPMGTPLDIFHRDRQ